LPTEKNDELRAELLAARNALQISDARFKVLADAMPQMVWSTLPDGFHDYYNARWYDFTGMPIGSTDGDGWNGMFHPEDQPKAWELWSHSLRTGDPYEIEYRLRDRHGQYRWTIGRALPIRDADGQITRWVGTCTDIHDSKIQSERTELLTRELSHRIKNIFAVISGLISLTARKFPECRQFADSLRARVSALGRAHEIARPHSLLSAPVAGSATLKTLLRAVLLPYPAMEEGRITITGADFDIDDRGATPLGLLFHELATNAAKYGSLLRDDGAIDIRISEQLGQVRIQWTEVGGPEIPGAPESTGFGTQLANLSIVDQLGGTISREWAPSGLGIVVEVPRARLSRDAEL
jgi:PAS domain S-box-containing protein